MGFKPTAYADSATAAHCVLPMRFELTHSLGLSQFPLPVGVQEVGWSSVRNSPQPAPMRRRGNGLHALRAEVSTISGSISHTWCAGGLTKGIAPDGQFLFLPIRYRVGVEVHSLYSEGVRRLKLEGNSFGDGGNYAKTVLNSCCLVKIYSNGTERRQPLDFSKDRVKRTWDDLQRYVSSANAKLDVLWAETEN